MKKLLLIIALLATTGLTIAQAPVPSYWDCSDVNNLPLGYSIGPSSYPPQNYAFEGVGGGPCVKLRGTGNYVEIHLAGEAGVFSYWVKGNSLNPPPFDGDLEVQISDNGTSWTTKRTLSNGQINLSTIAQFTDTAESTTRYIRFYFSRKVSGFNLSLDEINIGNPLPKPSAEINAVIGGDTVFSGGTTYISENVGLTKRLNIIIENQGTDSTLMLSSVVSSNNTEFNLVSYPSSIDSLTSDTIKIDFIPSITGTRTSTLTIANNDTNENPYIINLVGYGDGLATEPSVPASVTFASVLTYDYEVEIHPTTPLNDEGYLVLFSKTAIPPVSPTDGMLYSPGDMIGGAKVAYVGTDTVYSAKEVWANTKYYVSVFAYSGNGTYRNYTNTALVDSVTTPATMQSPSHYSSVSTSVSSFIADLHALVNPHTLRFYSDFDETYIDEFGSRDTTNGQLVVTCRYTSDEYIYTPPFSFSYISREHSFPQSWMPTYNDASFQSYPEYNDYHNLFPVNQASANSVRSNHPLGEVATVISSFMDGTYGTDTAGNTVYEPRDSHKGDAARAIFYQSIAYTSVSGNLWNLKDTIQVGPFSAPFKGQNQDVLKKWHWQDPVDGWEMARNDYIESVQGNRNPFIDSMEYVCYIDFMSMTRVVTSAPCTFTPVGLDELSGIKSLRVYPNPATTQLNVIYDLAELKDAAILIQDITGRTVVNSIKINNTFGNRMIDINHLPNGVYVLNFTNGQINKSVKFIKN